MLFWAIWVIQPSISEQMLLAEIIHLSLVGRLEGLFEEKHDKAERKCVLHYPGSANRTWGPMLPLYLCTIKESDAVMRRTGAATYAIEDPSSQSDEGDYHSGKNKEEEDEKSNLYW